VPRAFYAIITTAILIGVGIKVADSFFNSLENFLGIVSYWPGAFGTIIIIEHFYFRKGDASTYDQAIWNDGRKLPPGIAAISTGILTFGLIVPCMNTVWFVGPIGKITGDIGFEVSVAMAAILYIPLRTLEIRIFGRV
jgi:purine-cytosine permease-like protein